MSTLTADQMSVLCTPLERLIEEILVDGSGLIAIACSGGVDSMLLVDLLQDIRNTLSLTKDLQLIILTVDHGLHDQSEVIAQNTCQYWQKRGLLTQSIKVSVDRIHRGRGLEDGARQVRYEALLRAADELNAHCLITAHHLGDQVETFFMRIQAPAGLDALGGIPEKRNCLRRPWLKVPPHLIQSAHLLRGLPCFPDPTNEDHRFLRNAVRHVISPALNQVFSSGWMTRIAQSMAHLRQARRSLDYFIDQELDKALQLKTDIGRSIFIWPQGLSAPKEVQGNVILSAAQRSLYALLPPHADPRLIKKQLPVIEDVYSGSSNQLRSLPNDLWIWGGRGTFHFFSPHRAPILPDALSITLPTSPQKTMYAWGEWRLTLRPLDQISTLQGVSFKHISQPLRLELPGTGARYQPLHTEGTKRITRLWSDRKVPMYERDRLPVLFSAIGEIVWAPYCRPSATIASQTTDLPNSHPSEHLADTRWIIEWSLA